MMGPFQIDYPEDCLRLQRVALEHLRLWWDLPEWQEFWKLRSEDWCSSWIILPEDDVKLAQDIEQWLDILEAKLLKADPRNPG